MAFDRFVTDQIPSYVQIRLETSLGMSDQCLDTLASNLACARILGKKSEALPIKHCFTLKLRTDTHFIVIGKPNAADKKQCTFASLATSSNKNPAPRVSGFPEHSTEAAVPRCVTFSHCMRRRQGTTPPSKEIQCTIHAPHWTSIINIQISCVQSHGIPSL